MNFKNLQKNLEMFLVIELHCLHQTKTAKCIWIFETKTVSIHAYIRIKLHRILEFLSQKKWQIVSRLGAYFVTKKVAIHAYIRAKLHKVLGFLSHKKWQFLSRWGDDFCHKKSGKSLPTSD